MKIESRQFSPAPRIAERPQPAPAAARNTGTAPTSKRPSDGFESPSLTARKGGGSVGGAGSKPGKPALNMDFELDPSLEKHRSLFAKVGARIAKMPVEVQAKEVEKASKKLAEKLGHPFEIINKGVEAARAAAAKGPGTTSTNDPQCYRADAMLNYSPALKENGAALKNLGLSISKDSSLKTRDQILSVAKPEIDKLALNDREKSVAENYILALVKEDRALNGGSFGGGSRPTLPNHRPFHILPYKEG